MGGAQGTQAFANLLGRGDPDVIGRSAGPTQIAEASTTAHTVLPQQITVHVTGTGVFTLTMPEASAANRFVPYIVRLEEASTGVTVAFPGGTENPLDQVMTALLDNVIAQTDGKYWYVTGATLTP